LKSFEIIAGLLLAAILFVILKLVGMVVKIAAIAAVLGFVVGIVAARAFRR
jgi:membrane associated rhomboid family serine protease